MASWKAVTAIWHDICEWSGDRMGTCMTESIFYWVLYSLRNIELECVIYSADVWSFAWLWSDENKCWLAGAGVLNRAGRCLDRASCFVLGSCNYGPIPSSRAVVSATELLTPPPPPPEFDRIDWAFACPYKLEENLSKWLHILPK